MTHLHGILAAANELRAMLETYQLEVGAPAAAPLGATLLPVARTIENLCDGVMSVRVPRHMAAVYPIGALGAAERPLTRRQRTIARLIAEGLSNKMMADQLGLSVKTIETHRLQMMKRLRLHDTASVVRYAIRTGLVREDAPAFVA